MSKDQDVEVMDQIIQALDGLAPSDLDQDNDGQLVIYTGIYVWSDGSFHAECENIMGNPEPEDVA